MTRLQIAENFFNDAFNNEMSARSREDCAFNAGYLFALEAVPASFVEKQQHPCQRVVRAAARCLALDVAVMESALNFIREQYSPGRDGHHVEALLAWALAMKKAVNK
jgi:hypothetical protein